MSVETYECTRCGAYLGITGPGSGSEDDYAAEEYFASEVEYHESGQCNPAADPARVEYVAGLRALADLLESTPDLPLPTEREITWAAHTFQIYEGREPRETVATLARLLPGRLYKNDPAKGGYAEQYFELTGKLYGLGLRVWAERSEVCRRVVTGTREVTETVPAPDAPTIEVTRTVEDVEWVCEPLLADAVVA